LNATAKMDVTSPAVDVRFGSKADMCGATRDVRFTPESDIECVFSDVR